MMRNNKCQSSVRMEPTHIHTHTYVSIYIYIYMCVCVCVCGLFYYNYVTDDNYYHHSEVFIYFRMNQKCWF